MRELLIATGNAGKVRELRELLAGSSFTVVSLAERGITSEVEEPCRTFEGNALVKAFTYGKWANTLTLAEDSGLEIDALDGRPGVDTKPYVADTPDHGHAKLLAEIADVPEEKRGAQFRSVIAIYDPATDKVRVCEGVARGTMAHEAIGTNGFGQDPIFRYADSGKTGGEMTVTEKNAISHRSKAFAKAKQLLMTEFV
jgi:XTP/dITP diphosphohydrolase